jgi:hypothetical protein
MTRLVHFRLAVDGVHAAEYRADGVVVSTPVGSTAYSLSLGGPILMPDLWAMLVTPVAPQALANRPIVLSEHAHLRLVVEGRVDELALVLDGQERIDLASGDAIDVALGPRWCGWCRATTTPSRCCGTSCAGRRDPCWRPTAAMPIVERRARRRRVGTAADARGRPGEREPGRRGDRRAAADAELRPAAPDGEVAPCRGSGARHDAGMTSLPPEFFRRQDERPDALFYAVPRPAAHLDPEADAVVSAWYASCCRRGPRPRPPGRRRLSHLPVDCARVMGVGLDADALERNACLAERWLLDVNAEPRLPFADGAWWARCARSACST